MSAQKNHLRGTVKTRTFLHNHTETDLDISKRPGCFLMGFAVHDCHYSKCGSTAPWNEDLDWIKRELRTTLLCVCVLPEDTMWLPSSHSCCLPHPDGLWAKINPSFHELSCQVFCCSNKKQNKCNICNLGRDQFVCTRAKAESVISF